MQKILPEALCHKALQQDSADPTFAFAPLKGVSDSARTKLVQIASGLAFHILN